MWFWDGIFEGDFEAFLKEQREILRKFRPKTSFSAFLRYDVGEI